jgi:hypothetical protein
MYPAVAASAVKSLVKAGTVHGPVVMNEDHNGDAVTFANLDSKRETASNFLDAGGSWGLMWRPCNQFYPFRWSLGSSTD